MTQIAKYVIQALPLCSCKAVLKEANPKGQCLELTMLLLLLPGLQCSPQLSGEMDTASATRRLASLAAGQARWPGLLLPCCCGRSAHHPSSL